MESSLRNPDEENDHLPIIIHERQSAESDSFDKDLIVSNINFPEDERVSESKSILLENQMKEEDLAFYLSEVFVEPFYHNFDNLHMLGREWWNFKVHRSHSQTGTKSAYNRFSDKNPRQALDQH